MAGGGAVVAIIAAAHAQRLQAVTDAFRLAGATAPERAQSLATLGVAHEAEVAELASAGVLLRGPGRDTWYLSEAAVVARRDARRHVPRVLLVVLIVLLALTAILAGVLMNTRAS